MNKIIKDDKLILVNSNENKIDEINIIFTDEAADFLKKMF
jgi:hypothetical protein